MVADDDCWESWQSSYRSGDGKRVSSARTVPRVHRRYTHDRMWLVTHDSRRLSNKQETAGQPRKACRPETANYRATTSTVWSFTGRQPSGPIIHKPRTPLRLELPFPLCHCQLARSACCLFILLHINHQQESITLIMIVEPNAVMDSIMAAATSVAPIPSVVPTLPDFETAGETGHRTLWYDHL